MRRSVRTVAVLVALTLSGCGPSVQDFVPTERANTRTTAGFTAAQYDLWGPNGNLGEASVWSSGAYEVESGGLRGTVIEVRFHVESLTDRFMVLDEITLDGVALGGQRAPSLRPQRVEGERVVSPGQQASVRAYFVVPPQFEPDDIHGFRVRWQLRIGADVVYTQRTPFVQQPHYAYYTPYYDPFLAWGPGWGPGWGVGWGPGWGWGGGLWLAPQSGPMRTEIRPDHALDRTEPAQEEATRA